MTTHLSARLRWHRDAGTGACVAIPPKVVGSNPTPATTEIDPKRKAAGGRMESPIFGSLLQRSPARTSHIQSRVRFERTYAPACTKLLKRTDGDGPFGLAVELLLCIHICHGATPGIATGRETVADHVLLGQSPGTSVRRNGRTDLARTGLRARCGPDRLARCPGGSRSPGRAACLLGLSGYLGWTTGGDPARSRHSSVLGRDQSVSETGGIAARPKGPATAQGMSALSI
jgi:hypothetical protein